MIYTLTLLIFFAAIAAIFSDEFVGIFKKIFSYRWAQILLPLALASWIINVFDIWFLWIMYYYLDCLKACVAFITKLLPAKQIYLYGTWIILITLVSYLPVLVLNEYLRRKTYRPYRYPYLTSTLIWLFTTMLCITTQAVP